MSTVPVRHNNRTGSRLSEEELQKMVDGTKEFGPTSKGSAQLIAQNRMSYAEDGETLGSYPPPENARVFKDAADKAPNEQSMDLFMDKLGARLAFERTGVRLYEGMIAKVDALGSFDGGPSVGDLEHIRSDELTHFNLLRDCIEQLGGDPTAMTPSADVDATLGEGATKVMVDPRIGVIDSLQALLIAELADHAGWDALHEIAKSVGADEMAEKFDKALDEEEEHLRSVEQWMGAAFSSMTA